MPIVGAHALGQRNQVLDRDRNAGQRPVVAGLDRIRLGERTLLAERHERVQLAVQALDRLVGGLHQLARADTSPSRTIAASSTAGLNIRSSAISLSSRALARSLTDAERAPSGIIARMPSSARPRGDPDRDGDALRRRPAPSTRPPRAGSPRHLVEHGSDGLVVAGTTGESPTLDDDEKLRAARGR